MQRKTKFLPALLVTLGMLLTLTACSSSGGNSGEKGTEPGTKKTQVRIAYFPNITHTQALVMKNKKTLETDWKDVCDVKWISFNAGPAEIEAIFAGEIDLGYIGPVPAISANVKSDGEVKIISNATNAGTILLKRKDSGIHSVKDLAGKKIAVPQLGNTQHLCLLSLLAENSLKTTDKGGDVTITASSNADILNLIDNGSVDAALVPEPWGTTIENNGNADVLLDYDKVFLNGNYPVAVAIANGDFMEEHPDLVKEFLKAHEEATLFIRDNPDEAQQIVNFEIKESTGKALESSVIKSSFHRIVADSALNRDAVMHFANLSAEEGFIDRAPEENDVFKTEFN